MIFHLLQTDCKTSCLEDSGHLLVLFRALNRERKKKIWKENIAGIETEMEEWH